jgi:hypothetical protein
MNYIAGNTHPNISFAVSCSARYSVKPSLTHWNEIKKIWQYLRRTQDLKLTLEVKYSSSFLNIYSETTWGDNPDSRTSQSRFICYLFGSPISWNSFQQRCITCSSTEAKLNPLVKLIHEGSWIKSLINEIWDLCLESALHYINDSMKN